MVRRIPSQVHKQVSRLLKNRFLPSEPVWYKAVLDHPPLPLPPRATSSRASFDLPGPRVHAHSSKPVKPPKLKTQPITYLEDEIRRQFFRDHPFEAFRPRSIVEKGTLDKELVGEQWTRLSQRSRNPSSEDAIQFALNLHQYHYMGPAKTQKVPLSRAYGMAVMQFRSLRAERELAATVATMEAQSYGAEFGPTEIEKHFDQEVEHLRTWEAKRGSVENPSASRKRWKAILDRSGNQGTWSSGRDYVRFWQEGHRPDYSPALTAPVAATDQPLTNDQTAADGDFMALKVQVQVH